MPNRFYGWHAVIILKHGHVGLGLFILTYETLILQK